MLLANAFPRSYIAVVKPARMERATFSCYDNLVPSNSVGCPEHCDNAGAVPHLRLLLRGLQVPDHKPMTLIGFSKGVVVLNQILRELSTLSAHNLDLTSMVWLDGGHNGGQDIWPTERRLLQGLVETGIRVEV